MFTGTRAALGVAALACALASPAAHAGELCRAATPAEAAFYSNPVAMPGVISPIDGTCFVNNLRIPTRDGVVLTANVFLPPGASTTSKRPGVMYIGSWACADFFEYVGQQHRMARDGYVAMSYTARGFWGSGGTVNVAADIDRADVSSAIDFMLAQTPVDPQRLGVAGISYGAGLALMALASEPRIKAVVAMSGWANLIDQAYANEVPNATWLDFLVLSGQITGRLDPSVVQLNQTLQNPDATAAQVADAAAWARPRSPSSYLDAINRSGVPVLITKNWQDYMFTPNSMLALFSRLTVPKKMALVPGMHGGAELPGAIFGVDNPVMDEQHKWFDRWLKGIANGVETGPRVVMQPKNASTYDGLSAWPAPELRTLSYQLKPRGASRWDWGCFCYKGVFGEMGATANAQTASDVIDNGWDSSATSGAIPILTPALEGAIGLPTINHMGSLLPNISVRYEGPALAQPLKLRGAPKVQLRVRPWQARGMLVAYLYDVDGAGWGTLITHGARALHRATPGVAVDFGFDLAAMAYDVPAGHHLVLVFDTQDSLYGAPVNFGERFTMALEFSPATASALSLPVR